jgi:RND family efflux transporter MFP subunit
MKTKPTGIFLIALLAALGVGAFLSTPSTQRSLAGEPAKTLYTCGMHPQVIQDHPGNCPICGMKLTPVRNREESAKDGGVSNSSTITIDPATTQRMNLRTAVVTNGPLRRTIRSVGVVEFDETSLAEVTTKFRGWVEKLYVDSTGTQVHRGDPLFEVYSPELYSAQTEYLLAIAQAERGGAGSETLKASALTRLKFFDISDEQIAELEKTKQARKTVVIHSPRDGVVVEKTVVQGQMVDAGMKLYRLADLSLVWVVAQVYEQDLPFMKLGQETDVKLSYLPDREFRGRVTYIYPTLDEKTRTARVRMEFHNPGFFLKPGMFATVELHSELQPSVLLVPDMAILRSGEKNTVFVALDGGKFEPRTITLGLRADNNLHQVLTGLHEGERVVTSGQFMLDSESQLLEAIQKMNHAPEEKVETVKPVPAPVETTAAPADTNAVVYICPMPEHVAIKYDHPGDCPICGMPLVPVTEQTLAKLQPGGQVKYYVCPMTDACPTPGHGAVKYEKPGKCPVCGMTLVPVMETSPATSTPEHQH